jgi:hypothetical protein
MSRESSFPNDPSSWVRHAIGVVGLAAIVSILLTALVWTPWESRRIDPMALDQHVVVGRPVLTDFSGYVGDQACARCHPGESAAQAGSGHHRTLWPAAEGATARWLDGRRFPDPELPGVEWSYHLRDGKLEAERHEGDKTEVCPLEFGLGSGKHGVTFITVTDREGPQRSGLEHRLSYYTSRHTMDITPGQEKTETRRLRLTVARLGRELIPDRLYACIDCHSTLTSRERADQVDPKSLVPNVNCERCHGAGRDHVEAVERGETEDLKMPMTMLTDPLYQIQQCGACHRLPDKVDPAMLHPSEPHVVRFQSVGLSLSPCFKNGLGSLKCTSCHEAHSRTSKDEAAYQAVCLECHTPGGSRSLCPVSKEDGCIRCHMPKRELPGDFVFTDHWIQKATGEQRASTPREMTPEDRLKVMP